MNNKKTYFATDYITNKHGIEAALIFGHIAYWCVQDKFDASPQAIATVLRISKTTAKKYRNLFIKLGYFSVVESQYKDGKALVFNFESTDIDAHKLFETYQTAFGSGSKPDNGIALVEMNLAELPKNMTNHKCSYFRGLLFFKSYIRDKLAVGKVSDKEKVNAKSHVKLGLSLGLHPKTIAKYITKLVKQKFIQVLRKGKVFNGSLIIMTAAKLALAVYEKAQNMKDKIQDARKQTFFERHKLAPT